ncbi:MAG: hypothetical protein QOF51_2607 [Chloroflexota bacterium]|jgi:uncharacterized protein YecE (DUF72 family)|nr:hypothetical protein [Chloroflexota bacterium]
MIRIGTAGWSYPTGKGAWKGLFYPERGGDALQFYARYFDTVEVNNTFYRPQPPSVTAAWAEKTPPEFRFAIKLFQKFTHPKMFREATGEEADVDRGDFARFEEMLVPLADAGKLGPLLAQFPPSFKRDPETLGYLEELAQHFAAYNLAVELRHRSWTASPEAAALLRRHGVSLVHVDEPKFATSARDVPQTGPLGYFRFHGRNFKEWWTGDRETRYDYLYTPKEQSQLAQRILEVAEVTRNVYVTYNNHYGAKAIANALQLKLMLGQDVPPDVPKPLLEAYPDLADLLTREHAERNLAS